MNDKIKNRPVFAAMFTGIGCSKVTDVISSEEDWGVSSESEATGFISTKGLSSSTEEV